MYQDSTASLKQDPNASRVRSEKIQSQTKAFIKSGGKVTKIEPGVIKGSVKVKSNWVQDNNRKKQTAVALND